MCSNRPKIDATQPSQPLHLRAIVCYGIGVDNIDLDEATWLGIHVPDVHDSKPGQSNRHNARGLASGKDARGPIKKAALESFKYLGELFPTT